MIQVFKDKITAIRANYNRREELLHSKGLFTYIFNSSGYVLVIILIVISLLFSISTEFLITAQVNINYIKKFDERLQAEILARSGVNLAAFVLKADEKGWAQMFLGQSSADKNIDCFDDIWAIDFPALPIEDGWLKLDIEDQNAKINLSVLSNEAVMDKTKFYGITQRFFLNMGLPMDLADTIIDWVDVDDSRYPYGAESSDYYQSLEFPYEAKNGPMDSISELLMVKGITPEIFYGMGGGNFGMEENLVESNRVQTGIDAGFLSDLDTENLMESITGAIQEEGEEAEMNIGKEKSRRLSDYLRVNGNRDVWYDELNKININTASYRVLSALTDNTTDDIVSEIISRRNASPFKNVDEIADLIEDETVRKNCLTVKSYIFKITSYGMINDTTVKIHGIYDRRSQKFLYWSEN